MPPDLPLLTKAELDELHRIFEGATPSGWTRTVLRLLAQLERAEAAIRKYPTWSSSGNCYVCKYSYIGNHAPDCIRAALEKGQS